jgi:hypothetical protein
MRSHTLHTETHANDSGVLQFPSKAGQRHISVVREGGTAGSLAASGVSLWYLFRDLMAGHPLFTPRLLGQGFGRIFGIHAMSEGTMAPILGYTAIHYLGFIGLGIVAAAVVRVAWRQATVLAGALLAFVVAEMAFFVGIGLLNQATLDGMLGWSQLAAGNIIGCAVLGFVFWRTHPELPNELRTAMSGTGTWSAR